MLELSTDNNVNLFIERLNPDNLNLEFENIEFFSVKLNELDLIKLKVPSESEMCGIIAGERSMYDEIIKERLSCKICLEYDVPSFGGIPVAKPF